MEKGSLGEPGMWEAPAVHLAAPRGSWKLQHGWELEQRQLKKKKGQIPYSLGSASITQGHGLVSKYRSHSSFQHDTASHGVKPSMCSTVPWQDSNCF